MQYIVHVHIENVHSTYKCTLMYMYTHIHVHVHTYVHTHIHMYMYIYTQTHHIFLFLDGDPQLLIATIDGILSSDVRGENPFYFQMSGTDRSISECHVTYM